MPLRTYCESVVSTTSQERLSASSARMAAISSMRLLVLSGSPPDSSRSWPFQRSSAPQPPGPGFPRHAPSVQICTVCFMFRTLEVPDSRDSCCLAVAGNGRPTCCHAGRAPALRADARQLRALARHQYQQRRKAGHHTTHMRNHRGLQLQSKAKMQPLKLGPGGQPQGARPCLAPRLAMPWIGRNGDNKSTQPENTHRSEERRVGKDTRSAWERCEGTEK